MMTIEHWIAPRRLRAAIAMLVALALALSGAGCAAPSSPRPGAYATLAAVVIDAQRLARGDEWSQVRVSRGGAQVATQPGMALRPGDLVQTGPNAHAVLHYAQAEVLMRPGSQGRVGSLSEVIGEVFAKIRGVFAVETTFVRAGANGTAYLVRGAADGATVVTVFDGTVTLSSRAGAWPPQALSVGGTAFCPPRGGAPRVGPASREELEQTRGWVERIEKVVSPRASHGTAAAVAGIAVLLEAILSNRGGGRSSSGSGTPAGAGTTGGTPPASPDATGRTGGGAPVYGAPGREERRAPAPAPAAPVPR